jgi:diaminohydroxyphosphoribosylaminopyrimidine deaminase/5-amino-6-(5-phosphoribosylamino)uracil reductase
LVEGGSKIFSSFLDSGLVDELQIFTAPIIIGNGINAFGSMTTKSIEEAKHFSLINATKTGKDYHLIMKREIT